MKIPSEAQCKKEILHDWVLLKDAIDFQKEYCRFCKQEVVFKKHKKTGRVDNVKYYLTHLRDFLQPRGEMYDLYVRVYGNIRLRERREEIKRRKDPKQEFGRIQEEIKDETKFYNKYPSKAL